MKKDFRFNIAVLSIILTILSLSSCSNAQETKLVYIETDTIKQSVKEKEVTITWTQELEGNILSEKISRDSVILGPDVPFVRDIYKISKTYQDPVFPYLNDFGSLDISTLKTSIKEKLDKFCNAFSGADHKGAESSFSSKFIFNYIFFKKDFDEGWKKYFEAELPEEKSFFTKWIYGEPFYGQDIIQIPVRFYSDCGTIDMTVFLKSDGNNEFYQITIDRWQKV